MFAVGTFTRTAATLDATRLAVNLLTQMAGGDITESEMSFAKDYLAGVYPIQSETAEQVAGRVIAAAAYDLPSDYNSTYPDKIRAVTTGQVREMARRYLKTNDLDIVLAGNVSAFRDALKKEFPGAIFNEIPFDQIDLLSSDLHKAKSSAAVRSEAPSGAAR